MINNLHLPKYGSNKDISLKVEQIITPQSEFYYRIGPEKVSKARLMQTKLDQALLRLEKARKVKLTGFQIQSYSRTLEDEESIRKSQFNLQESNQKASRLLHRNILYTDNPLYISNILNLSKDQRLPKVHNQRIEILDFLPVIDRPQSCKKPYQYSSQLLDPTLKPVSSLSPIALKKQKNNDKLRVIQINQFLQVQRDKIKGSVQEHRVQQNNFIQFKKTSQRYRSRSPQINPPTSFYDEYHKPYTQTFKFSKANLKKHTNAIGKIL